MESFIGNLLDLRDKIGECLTRHVNELNESHTTKDIAKLHNLTIGIISNINTGNHKRVSFSAILEAADKLGFAYSFSVNNENGVSKISYEINLLKKVI